jgi:ribulose-5-phosphate 4-epimerase/fuculose-1-phosphate aldolase
MADLRIDVAWGSRILALYGHGDLTLGHLSARSADGERVYIKRKGIGLDEVTPDDVMAIDLAGRRVAGSGKIHLESPLHTEVYKRRPDVGAVVHTHPPYATAFGAVDGRLLYLSHDALLFPEGLSVFEETAALITSSELGAAIAQSLEDRRAVLLRNHGVLVVGRDVRWAVLTAITLERALWIQSLATALGTPRPIPDRLVASLHASKYRGEFLEEYWTYWLRQLRRHGLDAGMPADTPRGMRP